MRHAIVNVVLLIVLVPIAVICASLELLSRRLTKW